MRIAVCLSGQSRTWRVGVEQALYFFSGEHDYTFFGHTWDENSWKVINDGKREYVLEKLDPIELKENLAKAWDLTTIKVDPQEICDNNGSWRTWKPMMKSGMLVTHLKSQYEADRDMRFDLVVRTRWDVAYPPDKRFEDFLPNQINPTALYTDMTEFEREFRLPAIDDIFYFGLSRVIDIVESFYWYYVSEKFNDVTGHDLYNITYDKVGVGVLLYKWCTMKNIRVISDWAFYPIIIRKSLKDLKLPEDYDEIRNDFINFHAV